MGEKVAEGRYTAELDEDGTVVFLIGMRLNAWWRVDKWWPVFTAMPRMLRDLERRDAGLLGWKLWPAGRDVMVVQYWRSAAELQAFASDPAAPHAPAWREFNRRIGADGSVGVWHETYVVGPGRAEAIYANMPPVGLAKATRHVPVGRGRGTAASRLAASTG